eukprot:173890_1
MVALSDVSKGKFICKYFKREYNIIRNEPIGIRHILAIIIYTDMTAFCTSFRATYRRIETETEEFEVVERHKQMYFYARSLYEAVEFFGRYMNKKLTVYHGLNKVMNFEQFTAHFNQPVSTTTDKIVAQKFSQNVGIILVLRSGA